MGEPARGYTNSHPPYEADNVAALKHGLFWRRRVERADGEAEELAEQVADEFPWTAPFADERRAYARAVIDESDVRDYCDEVGWFDEDGDERSCVRTLARCEGKSNRHRVALGLQPMAAARLMSLLHGVVRAHPQDAPDTGLDALVALGRAALERGAQAEP